MKLEGGPIKSDGGSSTYYDIPIPKWLLERMAKRARDEGYYIKTEELIEIAFDNDFDFGTAFKSLIRARGITKGGGKAGNTLDYECNKVAYYNEKVREKGNRG